MHSLVQLGKLILISIQTCMTVIGCFFLKKKKTGKRKPTNNVDTCFPFL